MEPSRREEDNAARLELIVRIALLIAEFLVGLLFQSSRVTTILAGGGGSLHQPTQLQQIHSREALSAAQVEGFRQVRASSSEQIEGLLLELATVGVGTPLAVGL